MEDTSRRLDGLTPDAIAVIAPASGTSTRKERRAVYERLLGTSNGWASWACPTRMKVLMIEAPTLAEAGEQFMTLERTVRPCHLSQDQARCQFDRSFGFRRQHTHAVFLLHRLGQKVPVVEVGSDGGSIPVFMQHLAPVGAVYDRTRRPHRRELSV